jgi:hypothetical protein
LQPQNDVVVQVIDEGVEIGSIPERNIFFRKMSSIILLNLKFQPDKFKNNEENAIIVFCSFIKSQHKPYLHIAISKAKKMER